MRDKNMLLIANTSHEKQFDWGDIFVQGGENGVVGTPSGAYRTAFVEAFPKDPSTFIRVEGESVKEAEKSAWEQYQRILSCTVHEFERRGYKNGAGICKNCNLFKSKVFDPYEKCVVCLKPTYNVSDVDGNWYCEEHEELIPEEKQTEIYKWYKKQLKIIRNYKERKQ